MDSRMEKHYKQDLSLYKRTNRNARLYQEVYGVENDFEDLPVSNNVKELDLNSFNNEIASREEYQKLKDYNNISNTKKNEEKKEYVEESKQKPVYDINELLEKAKNENKKVLQESQVVDDKYLKRLESFATPIEDNLIKDKQEDIPIKEDNSFEKKVEEKMYKTASLSLDILSDLKPDDNTMVSAPIKEEVQEETIDNKEENNKDAIFYSGTYSFKKEDFDVEGKDNDFSDIQSSGSTLKIVLLLLGIVICLVMIFLTLKYLKII